MTFKTLFVVIQSELDIEHVTDCAIALASRFGAHLIGSHTETIAVSYSSPIDIPDPEFIQISTEMNQERSQKLEARFREKVGAAGIPFDWQAFETFSGDGGHSSATSARSADLLIAAQTDGRSGPEAAPDLDALIGDAGRPVLLIPRDGSALTTFGRVLIAWNGSREASRATFDALPFLVEAESVEILVIYAPAYDEGFGRMGADIAASLARHEIKVHLHGEDSGGRSTDAVIQERIASTGADLLVLGASSHSWLRDWFFGGVKSALLKSLPITTLLSR